MTTSPARDRADPASREHAFDDLPARLADDALLAAVSARECLIRLNPLRGLACDPAPTVRAVRLPPLLWDGETASGLYSVSACASCAAILAATDPTLDRLVDTYPRLMISRILGALVAAQKAMIDDRSLTIAGIRRDDTLFVVESRDDFPKLEAWLPGRSYTASTPPRYDSTETIIIGLQDRRSVPAARRGIVRIPDETLVEAVAGLVLSYRIEI